MAPSHSPRDPQLRDRPALVLEPKTVADYVSDVLHKLQVADRNEAALRAREAGLE